MDALSSFKRAELTYHEIVSKVYENRSFLCEISDEKVKEIAADILNTITEYQDVKTVLKNLKWIAENKVQEKWYSKNESGAVRVARELLELNLTPLEIFSFDTCENMRELVKELSDEKTGYIKKNEIMLKITFLIPDYCIDLIDKFNIKKKEAPEGLYELMRMINYSTRKLLDNYNLGNIELAMKYMTGENFYTVWDLSNINDV
jgi:hypothetical protein